MAADRSSKLPKPAAKKRVSLEPPTTPIPASMPTPFGPGKLPSHAPITAPSTPPTTLPRPARYSRVERNTAESQIQLELHLDGGGDYQGTTGLPFFDHMLVLLARHGRIDITVQMTGDLPVDCHHSVEDLGIVFGQCLKKAAGDKKGIVRYGFSSVPMEETLVQCTLDFCGRPYLHWGLPPFDRPMIGEFATEIVEDFFRAVLVNGGITAHFECPRGRNVHHLIEAAFKAFARALRQSLEMDPRASGEIPSTKGLLTD